MRDFVAIADGYRTDVLARRIPASKWTRAACRRQREDLKRAKRKRNPWPFVFDVGEAARVCAFMETLPHVEGTWDSPTIVLEPWQCFLLTTVFGWRHRDEPARRRFNTVYLEVARKNAKSAISSGIALYGLTCENEPGPQVKTAATTGDQARIVFGIASKMADKTPAMRAHFDLECMANVVLCRRNLGSIMPINAKASTQDGLNPHLAILDELHAHKTRDLFDVLRSARGARKNPLTWMVTTAGYDIEGVCYEQRTLLTKILDGVVEADHFFGLIYTLDENDDPFDESKWIKANPNIDVSVQRDELRGYATEARHSPDLMGEFKTKRMNQWLTARGAWLNMVRWAQCDGAVDIEELERVPCYAGLDLASTADINAFVLAWLVEGRLKVWPRFWLPEEAIRPRTERGNVPYQRWHDAGFLFATPGNVTDYAFIEDAVTASLERFNVREIAYDPWNATDLATRLADDGAPMVEFIQGPKSYHPAMKALERHVLARTLDHGANPVLNWMASNVVARKDVNENMAPDRKNSKEKIDGIAALLMALARAQRGDDGRSIYLSDKRPEGFVQL